MSSFFNWLFSLFSGRPISEVLTEPPKPSVPQEPILVDFSTYTNKVVLFDEIEFRVETSPRGRYENVELTLEGTQNIKIIQPFDQETGTMVIRFNKRSRNAGETQTIIATDGVNTFKLDITVSLLKLFWKHHPGRANVCDGERFHNQCAIRMGQALELSSIRLSSDRKVLRRCSTEFRGYKSHKQGKVKGHVLAAQELANWLRTQNGIFGARHIYYSKDDIVGRTGVIFFRDGWDTTDHIDVWNGAALAGGFDSYFDSDFKDLWFWDVY
ncbi:MAG: hypothetical protein KAG28_04685 [Cocleimonas sp.]|nr:hypothetical protein [Cocleimonas sp.]